MAWPQGYTLQGRSLDGGLRLGGQLERVVGASESQKCWTVSGSTPLHEEDDEKLSRSVGCRSLVTCQLCTISGEKHHAVRQSRLVDESPHRIASSPQRRAHPRDLPVSVSQPDSDHPHCRLEHGFLTNWD